VHLPERFATWAPVYLALATHYQMGQVEADGCELWVLGVMLNPEGFEPGEDDGMGDRMMTPDEFQAEAARLLRERVAAAVIAVPPTIAP
jgi:hypothetical protein